MLFRSDLDAYDLYLAGRAQMRSRGLDGITQATELFEAAVARDSTWAPAWAGLAESRALYPFYADGSNASRDSAVWRRSLEGAEEAAQHALDLDSLAADAGRDPAEIKRTSSLSLDDLGTAHKHASKWHDAGYDYLVCGWPDAGREQVERFVEEVVPEFS